MFVCQDRQIKFLAFQLKQTTHRKNWKKLSAKLKFCEVSRNSISRRCFPSWKTKKKVLFLKKKSLSRTDRVDPKDGVSCPNFQWRYIWWINSVYFPIQIFQKLTLMALLNDSIYAEIINYIQNTYRRRN